MPTSLHGYQRLIIKGVPVWKKDDSIYLYDTDIQTNPIKIGTLSGGFSENWTTVCKEKLETYRNDMIIRTRRTATSSKKK